MGAGTIVQFGLTNSITPLPVTNVSEGSGDFSQLLKGNFEKSESADGTMSTHETHDEKRVDKKTEGSEVFDRAKSTGMKGKNQSAQETTGVDSSKGVSDQNSSIETIEDASEVDEQTLAVIATVMEQIAVLLDIPLEQVEAAVFEAGLEPMDILDLQNVPKLVVQLTQAEDVLDIMTDEELFSTVTDISKLIEELPASLSADTTIKELVSDDEQSDISDADTSDADTIRMPVDADEKSLTQRRSGFEQSNESHMDFAQTFVENVKEQVAKQASPEFTYTASMSEIYEQVTESLRANISKEVSELEINLHPASLGNVKVNIAQRDGVISANFTTPNEQVKAALELQLVQLVDSMNEQGIKVESIEVTLAAHAFEQNLSEEGEQANRDEETKKKRRNINLNEIDEDDDINIEEDIKIAREMMMHSGTTVDYMA